MINMDYHTHELPAASGMLTTGLNSQGSLQRILDIAARRYYPPAVAIGKVGDTASSFFYVVHGSIAVCGADGKGRELILCNAGRGSLVGDEGLFTAHPKVQYVLRTRSHCELAEVRFDQFFGLLEQLPPAESRKLLYTVGVQMQQRLDRISRKAMRMAFMDVADRVARALFELCNEPDAIAHPEGTQVRISRHEMGRFVGCSRETVSRVLKQLEREGIISLHGRTIVVRKPD